MKYDKKSDLAKQVKLKLKQMISVQEKQNYWKKIQQEYDSKDHYGEIFICDEYLMTKGETKTMKEYDRGRYFTKEEKSFIIDYLLDCLVNNEPFDCSTLGPNEYLEENTNI